MFACEQEGVAPDLMCLAKGITGGYLPLAATLATERIYEAFLGAPRGERTFFHGHTYTGNPLACAAALARWSCSRRSARWSARAQGRAARRSSAAGRRPARRREVRQARLMGGIELGARARGAHGHRVTLEARRRGAIVRPLGDVVILMPPLSMTEQDLRRLVATTAESIAAATGAGSLAAAA